MADRPRLIEPTSKYYMSEILSKCHDTRVSVYQYSLNIGVFIVFIIVTSIVLYYCYRTKLTPEEEHNKSLKNQEYILSKIRFYKDHQRTIHSKSDITTLPTLDNRPL
jgi:hypothetical protein